MAAGLWQSCPGTRGCWLLAATPQLPHHCHHTPAKLVAHDPAVFQAKGGGAVRFSEAFCSYRLISRFASLLCPLSSPSFSFPSLAFCQIICCFFLSVLTAHWLVSLLLHPPQRKAFCCSEFDFYDAVPDRIGFLYIFKHYRITPVGF